MKATLHTDGACLGNPGPMGYGIVLEFEDGKKILKRLPGGQGTNNIAEYSALLAGIKLAKDHGATEIEAYMDSELVVKQVHGEYKVKDATLQVLHETIQEEIEGIPFTLKHIRREQTHLLTDSANKQQKQIRKLYLDSYNSLIVTDLLERVEQELQDLERRPNFPLGGNAYAVPHLVYRLELGVVIGQYVGPVSDEFVQAIATREGINPEYIFPPFSHAWNVLPDGTEIDVTATQFDPDNPRILILPDGTPHVHDETQKPEVTHRHFRRLTAEEFMSESHSRTHVQMRYAPP